MRAEDGKIDVTGRMSGHSKGVHTNEEEAHPVHQVSEGASRERHL